MKKLSALIAVLFASTSLAVFAAEGTAKSADSAKSTATAEPMKSDAMKSDTMKDTKKKSSKKKSSKKTKTADKSMDNMKSADKPMADKMDSKEAPKK